jgi:hypothetical protein
VSSDNRSLRLEGTLFHQDWMMDAGCKGQWDQVEVRWDNVPVLRLPYTINRRYGMRIVGMPYYTRVLGPIIHLPPAKSSRQLENAAGLIGQMFERLPSHDAFNQVMSPEYDLTDAFILAGHHVESGLTFRYNADLRPEDAKARMKGVMRRDINKGQQHYTVQNHYDLDQFISLAQQQIRASQTTSRHQFDLVESIFNAALKRGQTVILTAYDQVNRNMGTTVLLFDDAVVYFWLATRAVLAGNKAYPLLIWESYMFAKQRGLIFDFDGYPSIAGAQFMANFGGEPLKRNKAVSNGKLFDALLVVNRIVKDTRKNFKRSAGNPV